MARAGLSALCASALLGCGASKDLAFRGDTALPGDQDPAVTTTEDDGYGNSVGGGPAFYSLDGFLDLLAEEVQLDSSTVTVGYWTSDTNRLCRTTHTLDEATPVPNDDPQLPLLGWWALAVVPSDECLSYTTQLPPGMRVGIGVYDALLDPAAAAFGFDGQRAYGLYLQASAAAPVNVFGVAGTEGIFAGLEPLVGEPPLPDGRYELVGLHLLPL